MSRHHHLLALVLVSPWPLSAQSTFVSPAPASATVEGSSSNAFPWNTTIISRYMQIHSDTVGTSMLINKVAHRRNGAVMPTGGSRSVDLEMFMGDSVPYDRFSYVFTNNYVGTPVTVLPRQVVNIGPLSAAGSPAPFELAVPLATPYFYLGTNSLAWEVVEYSNSAVGSFGQLDAESGSPGSSSPVTQTGTGCTATGQAAVMDLGIQHAERGGTYQFGAYVLNAPANAPTVLYLGTSNPNLPFPGLCGNLYTDLVALVGTAVADASGSLREFGTTTTLNYPYAPWTFVLPNTLGQATLYAQAHAYDPGRSDPIPICNSNGRTWSVPAPNRTVVAMASRLYNFTLQGPTYPHATPLTLAHAYAAVTEFTY